jgi:ketosteroid isomerase-like protein
VFLQAGERQNARHCPDVVTKPTRYAAQMSQTSADIVVAAFNDCITRRDIDGLSRLMTDDHVFIDIANARVAGKASCVEAWKGFFQAFPDYRNHFDLVRVKGDDAVIVGRSTCSDKRLSGPALWSAKTVGGLVAEWRVYDDTSANRAVLLITD